MGNHIYTLQNLFLILFLATFLSCNQTGTKENKQTADGSEKLGEVTFEVTGAEEAQPSFKKGLLLLHSFEYDDARKAFLETQDIDSTFAMAYWGEAMSYNHSLWKKQELEEAKAALEKLAPTTEERQALLQTEIEKDFFKGIEILFGEGTKYERDIAYQKFMNSLRDKYPDQLEVSAFYAISLLGSARNGRDEELYEKSATIAKGILEENPNHPGALHYLIHSFDDPKHAHLAKDAADKYSVIAPDAAHALHMPSHIYVALGLWNEVVNSNIASWNASVKKKLSKDAKNGSYHALNWLQYGLLQRKENDLAARLVDDMISYKEENPSKSARMYLVAMKAAQMIETNTWSGELADLEIDIEDLPVAKKATYDFLEGMKAFHSKDEKSLKKIISNISKYKYVATLDIGESGFSMCGSQGFGNSPANQLDIDIVSVLEKELEAALLKMQGKTDASLIKLKEAVVLDETLNYSFGPPRIVKPVQEAYAEALLEQNKLGEAHVMFQAALKRQPNRLLSIQGLKKTAEKLGKVAEVKKMDALLKEHLEVVERGEIL